MWVLSIIVLVLVLSQAEGTEVTDYLRARENLINKEKSEFFGANLKLSEDEVVANKYLMSAKLKDFDEGFKEVSKFWPSRNFLDVYRNYEQSDLLKILQRMPKGSNLHAHGESAVSLDFTFKTLTHLPNLYVCFANKTIRFQFFDTPTKDCRWKLMEKLRKKDPKIDWKIRKHITLPSQENTRVYDQYLFWDKFEEVSQVLRGLYIYRPALELYYREALQVSYDDNVLYVEFRYPFFPIYELNGTIHDAVSVTRIIKRVVDEFVATHPGFIGARIIYESSRMLTREEFRKDMITFRKVKRAFPDFIVGLDVSSHEDKSHPDVYYIDELLKIRNETKFYFHTGETDWFGTSVDEDIFDAVLLNAARLGHAFALLKHPKLLEIVKKRNIPIELSPVSNQGFGLLNDLRNHPASHYFAKNMTVVVSSDTSSFWKSAGLSYSYYAAFLGIMPRHADLRVLKQLVINSINYSGMTKLEKQKAFKIFEKSWLKFIKQLVSECKWQKKNLNHHETSN